MNKKRETVLLSCMINKILKASCGYISEQAGGYNADITKSLQRGIRNIYISVLIFAIKHSNQSYSLYNGFMDNLASKTT